MTSLPNPQQLLEREAELEAIAIALAGATDGNGRFVLVEGPAGLGKSELLAAARRQAESSDIRVLAARGGEFEQNAPFGVARELFGGTLHAPDPSGTTATGTATDPDPRNPSGTTATGTATDPDPPTEARPASGDPATQALYWRLADMARDTPLLVSVDDAQWVDRPSLQFLLYVAQRIERLPVTLIVALRPEDAAAGGSGLARLRAVPEARVVQLQPLSPPATATLTQRSFSTADDDFCRAVFEASGGNPFLVRELLAALDLEGVIPNAATAARMAQLAPESVVRATGTRIAQLGPEARTVAEAAAVLGADAHIRHVARLAGLDPSVTAATAHELAAAGIFDPSGTAAAAHELAAAGIFDPSGTAATPHESAAAGIFAATGGPFRFSHLPVRAAVCNQIPPARRSVLHYEAAALLADDGAAPAVVASHLVQTDAVGAPGVVGPLRAAARQAIAAGNPGSAVRYLNRALAEPLPTADRADLLVETGRVSATIGDPEAIEHLDRAVRLMGGPQARAGALYEVGRTLVHSGRYEKAIGALRRGLEDAGPKPTELRRRLLGALLQATRLVPGSREIDLVDNAEAAVIDLEPDEPGLGALLGELSFERLMAGDTADEVRSSARLALTGFERPGFGPDQLPFYDAVAALTWADDLDAAKAALDQAVADAARQGRVMAVATARFRRAVVSYLQGSIPAAINDAQLAVDTAAHGWATYLPAARATLALALLEQGQLPRAAAVLEPEPPQSLYQRPDNGPADASAPASLMGAFFLQARSALHLAEGSAADARDDALAAGRIIRDEGTPFNPAVPWRLSAASAMHRLGAVDDARRLAAEGVDEARRFGAARSLGAALRIQGVVEGGQAGIACLEEAVATLAGSPARLEYARALTDLAEALSRAGRAGAEDVARQGFELAERCGATVLAARSRTALQAGGSRVARRRRDDPAALTPTEERVAGLAAGGLSNKDMARQLFVSVRAVEFHLGNVYTKLGISSRRQLAAALARRQNRPGRD